MIVGLPFSNWQYNDSRQSEITAAWGCILVWRELNLCGILYVHKYYLFQRRKQRICDERVHLVSLSTYFVIKGLYVKPNKVKATDLLYEIAENGWSQKISSNGKKRITTLGLEKITEQQDMIIRFFYKSLKQIQNYF